MNALLVHPPIADSFLGHQHALTFINKRAVSPPLGLLTVAALLPPEWNARLVDMNVQPLTDADLAWADCACISAACTQRDVARTLIARCRHAGLVIIAGGPLFTMEPEDFPEVDHLLLHEAETTVPLLLSDLARGTPRRMYRPEGFADMTRSPAPAWRLARLSSYALAAIQFSRGCPYGCEFCNMPFLLGRTLRRKAVPQIIAELDALWAAGWREQIFVVDDNLNLDARFLKQELLPALIRWQRHPARAWCNVPFYAQACITLADDDELMGMMVRAGFTQLFIGIETTDEAALAAAGKTPNRGRDLAGDVRRIQRAGMIVHAGMIVGFDTDTPAVFERHASFIRDTNTVLAKVSILQAPRHTPLYGRLEREGRIASPHPRDNTYGDTNIMPRMGLRALQSHYRDFQETLFSPGEYYGRLRSFVRASGVPRAGMRPSMSRLRGLCMVVWRLGIRAPSRGLFWRMVAAAARKPRLLPWALMLAAQCHHHHLFWAGLRRTTSQRAEGAAA